MSTDTDFPIEDAPIEKSQNGTEPVEIKPLEPLRNSLVTATGSATATATASPSPQIKQEELTNSRNTPVPQTLNYDIPAGLKPSEIIGGAPVRRWLNENVTPHLLEGVRKISKERPEDPLRVLGEYLIQQSEKR